MSSWPSMACDEMRKRHLYERINATLLKSIKTQRRARNNSNKTNEWYAEFKQFTCYLYPKICQLTSISSEKYGTIIVALKCRIMNFGDIFGVALTL